MIGQVLTVGFPILLQGAHQTTDVDGGILNSKVDYEYPTWIAGKSRADIDHSRIKARQLGKDDLPL